MPVGPTRDIGPCMVEFDDVEIGPTLGGVKFTHTENDVEVKEDQKGDTAVDAINIGTVTGVEAPFTRVQLAKMTALLSGAISTTGQVEVFASTGSSQYERAKKLVLKPIVLLDQVSGPENWITIYKASPKADWSLPYDYQNQRVYKTMFRVFPDQTEGPTKNAIFKIGTDA